MCFDYRGRGWPVGSSFHINSDEELTDAVDGENTSRISPVPLSDVIGFERPHQCYVDRLHLLITMGRYVDNGQMNLWSSDFGINISDI
jgi:hypothetical protein